MDVVCFSLADLPQAGACLVLGWNDTPFGVAFVLGAEVGIAGSPRKDDFRCCLFCESLLSIRASHHGACPRLER